MANDKAFQTINRGCNTVFRRDHLSLGLVVPLESYTRGQTPSMTRHLERVRLAEFGNGMDMLPKPLSGKLPLLITGSTDSVGLEAAKLLVQQGHQVLIHGRNRDKLQQVETELSGLAGEGRVTSYLADLSLMSQVESLAAAVTEHHQQLDVLINNAGVLNASEPKTGDGLDVRFAVNTIAPFLLTQRLMPLLATSDRVILE